MNFSAELSVPPTGNAARLYLARHGSTAANERRPFVLQGCEMNDPLTELGKRQASALADFLNHVDFTAIYSSPMHRALETAQQIASLRNLPVEQHDGLRECSVGRWEGLSWDQIREADSELCERFLANPADIPHPGGESFRELLARVLPAINEILSRHKNQNVLVVAHNLVNRVYIAHLLGIDLRFARRLRQANCCINVIHHSDDATEVVTLNSIWHLNRT